ncbi:AAA family ATPase [Clostridium thermobutyricum]|uniref:AAA family ATPase n=1 Tax=Clostridium thermobutyricum TaxID=29372 RepID=UPI003F52890E
MKSNILLEKIIIDGFKEVDKKVEFIFSKQDKINVLYGCNGIGKTTLLKLIYSIFDKDDEKLLNENVKNVYISYKNLNNDNYREILIRKSKNEFEYDWSELEDSDLNNFSILSISPNRGMDNYREDIGVDKIHKYLEENKINLSINSTYKDLANFVDYINTTDSTKIVNEIDKEGNLYISSINTINIENLILEYNEKSRMKKRLNIFGIKNTVLRNIIKFLEIKKQILVNTSEIDKKIEFEFTEDEINILLNGILEDVGAKDSLPKYMENRFYTEEEIDCLEEIRAEIKKFNYISRLERKKSFQYFEKLTQKKIRIHRGKVKVVLENIGVEHDLKLLSHGERHILALFSLIEYLGGKRALILIDEPDIALDTDWQEQLIDILSDLTNSQMILTSHSPYLTTEHLDKQITLNGGLKGAKFRE